MTRQTSRDLLEGKAANQTTPQQLEAWDRLWRRLFQELPTESSEAAQTTVEEKTGNPVNISECVFCGILSGELPSSIVYQDDRCTALMDIQPVNPGHTLIIPNRHATFLAELDEETSDSLFRAARRCAAALRGSDIRCEGVNFLLADGEAAGQEVFHVHLHVIPRYPDDGFGFRFGPNYTNKPERTELDDVAQRIKSAL